jgi:hypothetical protein
MHPKLEQLHAWLDGELGDVGGREKVAAHVEGCAHCRHVVTGGRQLGEALRLWADSSAPQPQGDLASRILAEEELGQAVRAWADESSPAPIDDLAGWVFQAAASAPDAPQPAASVSALASPTPAASVPATQPASLASTQGAAVVSLASRRRRWLWGAVPAVLAAAAAAVFGLARLQDRPSQTTSNQRRTEVAHHDVQRPDGASNGAQPQAPSEMATANGGRVDSQGPEQAQGRGVGDEVATEIEPTAATPAPESPAEQEQADKGGTDVLAVRSGDEVFSVVQVEGPRRGSTVAVAWFENTKRLPDSVE